MKKNPNFSSTSQLCFIHRGQIVRLDNCLVRRPDSTSKPRKNSDHSSKLTFSCPIKCVLYKTRGSRSQEASRKRKGERIREKTRRFHLPRNPRVLSVLILSPPNILLSFAVHPPPPLPPNKPQGTSAEVLSVLRPFENNH